MEKQNLTDVMNQLYPQGVFTEDAMWECIAEADGYERDYYEDGDIFEWL